MSLSLSPTSRPLNATRWFLRRAFAGVAAVALADWLFYDARGLGLSLPMFLAALAMLGLILNPLRARRAQQLVALFVLAVGLIALIEDVNLLSTLFGIGGLIFGALILVSPAAIPWTGLLQAAVLAPLTGPLLLTADAARVRAARNRRRTKARAFDYIGWIVPLICGGVFLALFASANPLIEGWLAALDLGVLFTLLSPYRVIFWSLVLCLVWPVLHIRAARAKAAKTLVQPETSEEWGGLMSAAAVLRSLILFNALFAFQTIMDIGYLWGGQALPAGLTHAAYAHRGAYPLVITALLAAAFVLVALRGKGRKGDSALIRPLLLIFVGQNILLVLSSILRLDLYVTAYSLTYWRVAAFIWMGLVALGLVLIAARIVRNTSNAWLLGANAAALTVTLYACCFVDFPDMIARFNFAHCREVAGTGPQLDKSYLRSLGPRAIPAIDAYRERFTNAAASDQTLDTLRQNLAATAAATPGNWRNWRFAAWRLEHYLANTKAVTAPATP